MEIRHRQQIGLTIRKPSFARGVLALGTMPVAARVLGDAAVRAVLTGFNGAAARRGPAELDRRHDAALDAATSSSERIAAPQAVGTTSSFNRSNGLWGAAIIVVATWV